MSFLQSVKNRLVRLGLRHPLVRLALKLHGRRQGYRVSFTPDKISLRRGNQTMIVRTRDYVLVPYLFQAFDAYFATVEAKPSGGEMVLDFSEAAYHKYRKHGVEFIAPGIAEDDAIEGYTAAFKPSEGMVVFDAGAHAGLSTYFLSRMVGPSGKVFAFEPDDGARQFLMQNIERQGLKNVTVLNIAMGSRNGEALFNMDGTVGTSLVECSFYPNTGANKPVEVVTLEECCRRVGHIPQFIKMDIEGSEVGVIESSLDFLNRHPIHFAFDSCHRTKDGSMTCYDLEKLFRSIDYHIESSDRFGEMLSWATPKRSSSIAEKKA